MSKITGETEMREHFWSLHLDEIERSGKTQQAYCDENNLKLATLGYWSKKLGRTKPRCAKTATQSKSFLNLGTTTRGTSLSNFDYEIVLGTRSLKFSQGFSTVEVKHLVEILSC